MPPTDLLKYIYVKLGKCNFNSFWLAKHEQPFIMMCLVFIRGDFKK